MRIGAALARIPPRIAFWAMAGVALFLSHDAVFMIQLGPGEALTRTLREAGHDYWGTASLALTVAGLAAALGAGMRLRRLRQRAARLGAIPRRAKPTRLLSTWLRLLVVVAAGFTIQENVEHYLTHGHVTALGVLIGPEYPLALPVIAVISGFGALLAAAVGGVERELLTAIAGALSNAFGRAPRSLARPPMQRWLPRVSPLARAVASRAPPRAFVPHN